MKLSISVCFLITVCFTSCEIERPVYYVSPFNGANTVYHTLPLKKDSIKTATYASGNLYWGVANTDQTDKVFQFIGSVYQAKQFGAFQAYYGGEISLGNYKVAPFDTSVDYTSRDFLTLNSMAGNKSYNAIGLVGGINAVKVTRHGEWRFIGTEFSLHNEMGAYHNFRAKLPDSAANLIIRNRVYSTLGLNTETVRKTKTGSYSLQFALGLALGKTYNRVQAFDYQLQNVGHISYTYTTLTFQYTYLRWTTYLQGTAGTYASGYHGGIILHLR